QGRIALDLDEVADRRLVERDRAALETPLLAPLLVAKAPRETEALQDPVRLPAVGDLDLALLAGLDAILKPRLALVGDDGLPCDGAQPHGAAARGEAARGVVRRRRNKVVEVVDFLVCRGKQLRSLVAEILAERPEVLRGELDLDLLAGTLRR